MENKPVKSSDLAYKLWLSLMLGIPLAVLIAFSSVLVSEKRNVLSEMDKLDGASHLIAHLSDTIHEMQRERGYTSGFIASSGKNFRTELAKQRAATDEQYALLLKSYLSVKRNAINNGMIEDLDLVMAVLENLKEIRASVDALKIGYFEAFGYYSKANSLMLDIIVFVPQVSGDREIGSLYLAYYHLQQVKEKAGMQRAALTYAFESKKFLPGQYERFLGIVADEAYSYKLFLSLAPPDIREAYLKILDTDEVHRADRMRRTVIEKGVMGNRFGANAVYWNVMQTKKINRINSVCDLLDERVRMAVDTRYRGAKHSLAIYLVVNLAVIVFVISMAVLLFRNIAKRREAEESLALYSKRMENALFRAKDVLVSIASPPDIVPFFTVSPVYRSIRSIGGGDIVKWVRFHSQYAALYMHDVAGHDIEEILLNILATSLVDTYKANPAKKSASIPSVFLNRMNEHLTKYCDGTPDYLTAVYLLMDFEEREIRVAAGGHSKPWLINPDGTIRNLEVPSGFILGQFNINPLHDDRYTDIAFHLETGQILLVYSDGLMEQTDAAGNTFEAKFRKEVGRKLAGLEPRAAHGLLLREFEAHLGGRVADDDVSFVFVGTRPAGNYETIRFVPGAELLSLISGHKSDRENDPAFSPKKNVAKIPLYQSADAPASTVIDTISESYGAVIEKLKIAQWDDKRISLVEMAVSEMIINAIMHGNMCSDRCTVEMSHILHADELEICVTDEGSGFNSKTLPQSVEYNVLSEGGRGHHMISAVADGLYFNDAGNRCWALFTKRTDK